MVWQEQEKLLWQKKAEMHANDGEKVLFLCYNVMLKNHLQEMYANDNIDYYTIDGLACKLCNTSSPDYDMLKEILTDMYLEKTFPYKHIVIDEGQDFGKESMTESDIVELLKSNVIDEEEETGTFYLFYDKNQMIQFNQVPPYINDADCKLTLYRNCRNTENIAITSLRLLGNENRPKLHDASIVGDSPELYFAENMEESINTLNYIIDECWRNGYENI